MKPSAITVLTEGYIQVCRSSIWMGFVYHGRQDYGGHVHDTPMNVAGLGKKLFQKYDTEGEPDLQKIHE